MFLNGFLYICTNPAAVWSCLPASHTCTSLRKGPNVSGTCVFCPRLVECGNSLLLWNITSVVCSFVHIALATNTWSAECNLKNKSFWVCCHSLKALRAATISLCTLFQSELSSPFKASLSSAIIPVSLTSQYLCFVFQRPEAFILDAICTWASYTWTQWGKKSYQRRWSIFFNFPTTNTCVYLKFSRVLIFKLFGTQGKVDFHPRTLFFWNIAFQFP